MTPRHSAKQFFSLFIAAALGQFAFSAALAQEPFPSRPITMVVPFPPGGVADTVGRPMAEAMGRILKQSVVVENRAGAGGGIGFAHVAKAKPDGYTILMALSSVSVIPEADRILGKAPSYELNQLKPIARITADPTVLVVRAETPWKTYKDFVADMRKNPAKFNYGSSGNYGTMHVPMEQLKAAEKFSITHIPYTGAGPAVIGLLGGQVDALATGPASIVSHIKSGKVRALAHWGEGRLAALPDVPSFKELGIAAEFAQWSGIFVPANTPDDVVTRLREAARQAANDEKVRQIISNSGSPIQFLDAPDFGRYVDTDAKKLAEVVKRIGKVQ
ncbi:MAG: tripartite tricarboxylate transporter substrate binding protein [Betaproteobacteria bacterium]|nr:tripartite tricarboxylate transporter substrate binding protein [Betaproteobacteria bacterium]